jgi:hypothetical protein
MSIFPEDTLRRCLTAKVFKTMTEVEQIELLNMLVEQRKAKPKDPISFKQVCSVNWFRSMIF